MSSPTRIVFLAHFYPPEMGGAAARLHGLARWLAEYGHDVTVITGFPNYPSGVIPDKYRGAFLRREEMDGVRVIRTLVYASPRRGSIRRLANYFSFVFTSLFVGLFLRRRPDVVVASCPPLFIGISGWLIALVRRSKFVFDLRDLWPDVAVEAGEFKRDSLITRLGFWLAKFLYNRAHHITPVTENKTQRLVEKGISEKKITVVANGVDLDLIPTLDQRESLRTELGLDGKFVVAYAGLIGIAQKVEMIIGTAQKVRDQSDIHFLIVGDGVRRNKLEELVREHQLDNVTLLPRQPKERISHLLSAADVAFVPLASSGLQDAIPSKLLEAWAHRRPVILVAGGEAAEIATSCEGAIVVAPEDPASITNAVTRFRDDPLMRDRYAENGYDYVAANLTRAQLARQMESVLLGIIDGQKKQRPQQVQTAS